MAEPSRRLWIVDPSIAHPEDEGIRSILHDWKGTHRVFRPVLEPGDGPTGETGYDTDGVVVMGSAASVHDRQPWIAPLADWLRPLLRGQPAIPVLGICFGHQLVAHLVGGEVGFVRPDRAKIVGIESTQVEGSRLVRGRSSLRVIASHCEEVKRAPVGFEVVARRDSAPIDGLEHRHLPIFSYQFHPEARGDFARRAGFDPDRIDDGVRRDSQILLGAFREAVAAGPKKRAGGRSAGSPE